MILCLTKFRGINIFPLELSGAFKDMNDYEKRKYILKIKNLCRLKITEKGKYLFDLINNFRKNNNIDKLSYGDTYFEDLIIDKYSEPIFYNNENIFKFANGNYLLKYPLNGFETKFNIKNKDIIDILLNANLKTIIIYEKNNYEYIYIFKPENKPFDYDEKICEKRYISGPKNNAIDSNETFEEIK